MPNFDEYIRNGEPDKKERASAWKTAIGLQAVDGLQTSDYLKDTAVKHIEGDISIDEVKALINGYYQSRLYALQMMKIRRKRTRFLPTLPES